MSHTPSHILCHTVSSEHRIKYTVPHGATCAPRNGRDDLQRGVPPNHLPVLAPP
jgi:hypothetical protein